MRHYDIGEQMDSIATERWVSADRILTFSTVSTKNHARDDHFCRPLLESWPTARKRRIWDPQAGKMAASASPTTCDRIKVSQGAQADERPLAARLITGQEDLRLPPTSHPPR